MIGDGVSKIVHDAQRKICGVGFVVLSHSQDQDSYIASCFRNNRITIITDDSEVIPNCIVSKNVWQYIEFPTDINSRGSQLVWINLPYQNGIIILDVINKRDELSSIQTKNQFKFQREVGNNVVTVQGDGESGTLTLTCQGDEAGNGEIYIKALNDSELAVLNVYVQGITTLDVENEIDIRVGKKIQIVIRDENTPSTQGSFGYTLGTGYQLTDEFNNNLNTKSGGVYAEVPTGNKVYARASNGVSEPGLLGNKTYQLLNEIQNLLSNMVTTFNGAAAGTYVIAPPVLAAAVGWQQSINSIVRELGTIKAQNFELS